MANHSQLAPLPNDLPFQLVSETLGRGAYAFVRKARELDGDQVFAVKFVHKQWAEEKGRVTKRQLAMEVSLHSYVGGSESGHANIIRFFRSEESEVWRWIAMEFADGGDLFDKIESDAGVSEDIAHFYFHQLVAGVSFLHSKGVAHRDIKPENILLDSDGNLKLGDFGFATLYSHRGQVKTSTQMVGSPPYIAPEICDETGYRGDRVDLWSCGVVLFVLLTGNTPWDEPTKASPEFVEYKTKNGKAQYSPWDTIPEDALSLIRGVMNINPDARFTFDDIKRHPWYQKPNPILSSSGKCKDGLSLATRLVEGLHVEFNNTPKTQVSATPESDGDAMMLDASQAATQDVVMSTQPSTYVPSTGQDGLNLGMDLLSLTQPTHHMRDWALSMNRNFEADIRSGLINDDPSMSQFSETPAVPLSLTQYARQFRDICPPVGFTRFYTVLSFEQFLPLISSALYQLRIPVPSFNRPRDYYMDIDNRIENIKIRMIDSRKCPLSGIIGIEMVCAPDERSGGGQLLCVNFEKARGDPTEWRRFFKKVTQLCGDAVYKGNQGE